jgi:hypothetical protein
LRAVDEHDGVGAFPFRRVELLTSDVVTLQHGSGPYWFVSVLLPRLLGLAVGHSSLDAGVMIDAGAFVTSPRAAPRALPSRSRRALRPDGCVR